VREVPFCILKFNDVVGEVDASHRERNFSGVDPELSTQIADK